MHNRLAPKKHKFNYNIFMFWLDIDRVGEVAERIPLFSHNKRGAFRFNDSDHFKYTEGDARNNLTVRQKLDAYLVEIGIVKMPTKVMLLTHVRMLGHVFNPVSFYFCFNEQDGCDYVVTEISNTFGEMKLFLVDRKNENVFEQYEQKYFYVSPFTDMDTSFEFRYKVPEEKLNIQINVQDKSGDKFFISTLTGTQKTLSNAQLWWYLFRFPFVTVKVVLGIHWQALLLWLKKLPYHKKGADAELQKGIINERK